MRRWRPPTLSGVGRPRSPRASSLGYRVSWEVYGRSDSRLTDTLNSTTHEYKIRGLSSLTTYTIDVAALTAAGAGAASSSTISSGVPPGQWEHRSVCAPPLRVLTSEGGDPPLREGVGVLRGWWAGG